MPDGELDGLKFRGETDEPVGATMINVAMALMREVKADIGRMSDKLDEIAKERRDEAREHGGLEVRVSNLETSHKAVRFVSYTVAAAVIAATLLWVIRIAALHPEALPK